MGKPKKNMKATWVENRESFKYKFIQFKHKINVLGLKRTINKILQKPRVIDLRIKWKEIFQSSMIWILEALVEGLIANFTTHYLFNVRFNIMMIFAHGFLIKQGLDVIARIKNKNEQNNKWIKEKEGE
jgi:hypothetical protein